MIESRDIIIFGDDYGKYPSTIQHIGNIFSKRNRVFWIGSLGLRKPKLNVYDLSRIISKGKNVIRGKKLISKNQYTINEIYPFVIPFHDFSAFRYLNRLSINVVMKLTAKKLRIRNPIIITSSPLIGNIIGDLGETSSHYFCLDDFTLFDGAFSSLGKLEQALLSKVDSCFAVSELLLKTRRVNSSHNYLLSQGVDTNHFSPSVEIHPKMMRFKSFQKPLIGFFGLLTTWVDIDLIIEASQIYRDYNFVIIGKSNIDLSKLSNVSNIFYLGEIAYDELPKFANAFDVGIIPFIINDLTKACNPLKLLEYLALGIPVISSDIPAARKFEDVIFIAEDRQQFIKLIPLALQDATVERNTLRRKIAEKYSWELIVEDISNKILTIEKEKMTL